MAIARRKTTVYLDPELLRAIKVLAASTGRHDYEVVEDALRRYLRSLSSEAGRQDLGDLLRLLDGRADLTDDAALSLAYSELRAARRARL
jgi:hypothetical protein